MSNEKSQWPVAAGGNFLHSSHDLLYTIQTKFINSTQNFDKKAGDQRAA